MIIFWCLMLILECNTLGYIVATSGGNRRKTLHHGLNTGIKLFKIENFLLRVWFELTCLLRVTVDKQFDQHAQWDQKEEVKK